MDVTIVSKLTLNDTHYEPCCETFVNTSQENRCFAFYWNVIIDVSGHANNVHCLAKAINSLAGALFTVHGPGDVDTRLKEFLAVSQLYNCHQFVYRAVLKSEVE